MATTHLLHERQASKGLLRLATISIAGVGYFAGIIVTLHFLRPDLNPVSQPTSQYAVGPYGWLMTSAFFSMSVASLTLLIGLAHGVSQAARSWIGLGLLGLWAVGVLIAMIFPIDPDGAPSTISGTIHQTAGPPTFLSLTVGMIFVSWAFQQDERWHPFYRTALTLSLVMLAAFIATFLSFVTDSGTLGFAQRIALATAVIWMLLTAARLRSVAFGSVSN